MAVMEAERKAPARHCQGVTKAGNPCRSPAVGEKGYCAVHDPESPFDFAELGRRGGRKAASRGRARRESAKATARDILRSQFLTDEDWQDALVSAYRRPVVEGAKDARDAANDLINQIEGKPQQNISARHEYQITVVSRLQAAIEAPADVDLPDADVTELEA